MASRYNVEVNVTLPKLSELLRKKFASVDPEADDLVPLDTDEARHCGYGLDQMHQWRKLYRIVEPSLKLSERIHERRILLAIPWWQK